MLSVCIYPYIFIYIYTYIYIYTCFHVASSLTEVFEFGSEHFRVDDNRGRNDFAVIFIDAWKVYVIALVFWVRGVGGYICKNVFDISCKIIPHSSVQT